MGKISLGDYFKGLGARLFVPLLFFGIFTQFALQVYLENLYKGTFRSAFYKFYPHYFDGMYCFGANFAWMAMHLWSLESLFSYSELYPPLFRW